MGEWANRMAEDEYEYRVDEQEKSELVDRIVAAVAVAVGADDDTEDDIRSAVSRVVWECES